VKDQELALLQRVRMVSTCAIALVTVLSLIFSSWLGTSNLSWQIAIALIALSAGIPHGALDHLVTLPKAAPLKMALFITVYVAVALASVFAILQWNVFGFIFVVVMSAVHFGIGDAAFISEIDRRDASVSRFPRFFYAAAAGSLPVVIPLVSTKSAAALAKVNDNLVDWHQGFDMQLQILVLLITVIAIVALIYTKRYRDLLDLALLAALAFIAPPLVAFAAYFGCWHAVRHTARLSLVLPRSQESLSKGNRSRAFLSAVIPGLPALVGTLVFAGAITLLGKDSISDRFFWITLVVVWALTVPHMVVTAKLDRAALSK
jgi:Brp/Blh family beta-carotene 15,15'-monooxygenase